MVRTDQYLGSKTGTLVRKPLDSQAVLLRPIDPITRTEFWSYQETAEERARYPEFKRSVQREATLQVVRMSQRLADFFAIPSEYLENTLPRVYVSDTIGGGTAYHHAMSNSISFPIKYAYSLHIGQANYLRETQFYPTLAHEVGHYVHSTALAQGDTSKFEPIYWKYEGIGFEFFAALCERVICEDMSINIEDRKRSDFGATDSHIGIALADEQYEEIKKLSPLERQKLALDFDLLLRYVDPQTIIDREKAIKEEYRQEEERRRRRRGR